MKYSVVVYMHTNKITNKSYIGVTKYTMESRFRQHIQEAHACTYKRSKFHRALRKYGASDDVWDHVVLYVCDTPNEGYRAEVELISTFGTLIDGYNNAPGGKAGPILVGADNGMWGKTHTEEAKQHIGQLAKERYTGKSYEERHGCDKAAELHKKRSTDMKRIRKDRPGNGVNNPNHKTEILTFTHTSGDQFIGTRQEFHETYNIRRSDISLLISGKQKTAKGWRILQP